MAYRDTPFPLDEKDALALAVVAVVAFVASLLYALLTQYPVAAALGAWVRLGVAAVFLYLCWRFVRAAERVADASERRDG